MHCIRRIVSRKSARLAACFAAALCGLPVAAQTSEPSNDWKYELVPYIWIPSVSTNLMLGPVPGNITRSSASILDALDFFAMGSFEARKGNWGGLLDVQYVKFGMPNQFAGGLPGGFTAEFEDSIVNMLGTYRVMDAPVSFDLLGGARYVHASTNVTIAPNLPGLERQLDDSVGWWNGVVGVRAIAPLADKWSLSGYLDYGSGSSSSSWQGVAGVSYALSPAISLKGGYRYLSLKRDEGLLNKLTLSGFYVGAGFKF